MTKKEEMFVIEKLKCERIVKYMDKFDFKPNNLSIDYIHNLLNSSCNNGISMFAISVIVKYFFSESFVSNFLLEIESKVIDEGRTSKIMEGFIFDKKFPIILKSFRPVYPEFYIIRELLIGTRYMNRLRILVPNFVYTYSEKTISNELSSDHKIQKKVLVLEKIDGEKLSDLLITSSLSFNEWLNIFCQILLALEVAQRKFSFTHFDLHCQNIIVRKVNCKYDVILDDHVFGVSNNHLPMIIDFGTSCIKDDDFFLGAHDYKKYGMLNFSIPGQDMYKLLINCLICSKNTSIFGSISRLLGFYGNNDPYNILSNINALEIADKEYCKNISYSSSASYTPHLFLSWILKKHNVGSISIKNRCILKFQYESLYTILGKVLNQSSIVKKILDDIIKDIDYESDSYMNSMYNLETFSYLHHNLLEYIEDLKDKLDKKHYLKDIDRYLLNKYFCLDTPLSEDNFLPFVSKILKVRLLNKSAESKKEIYRELGVVFEFEKKFVAYFELYYILKELNLGGFYNEWCKKFIRSSSYKFYTTHILKINQIKRWSETLITTIY